MGGSRISCSLWGRYLKKIKFSLRKNGHDVSGETADYYWSAVAYWRC